MIYIRIYLINMHECGWCEQLFRKPHPQKKLSVRGHPAGGTQLGFFVSSAANDRMFFHNVDNLRPSMQPLKGETLMLMHTTVCSIPSQCRCLVPAEIHSTETFFTGEILQRKKLSVLYHRYDVHCDFKLSGWLNSLRKLTDWLTDIHI